MATAMEEDTDPHWDAIAIAEQDATNSRKMELNFKYRQRLARRLILLEVCVCVCVCVCDALRCVTFPVADAREYYRQGGARANGRRALNDFNAHRDDARGLEFVLGKRVALA